MAATGSLPADDERFKEHYLVRRPMDDLSSVLNRFLASQRLLSSAAAVERLAFEAVEDAAREGVRLLELRYAPSFVALGHPLLKWDAIHEAVVRGLDRARREIPQVAVGLICIVQRILPLREAEDVVRFAIDNKDTFCAIDLADEEERFDCAPFVRAFEKARAAGLKATVHAGESNYPGSARAVIDAVERLGAMRIGHGVQIWRSEQALEFVKARKVPLELCPTSNWLTKAVPSLEAHPFIGLWEEGVSVTIGADDPGAFGIDLVHEYRVLQDLHGLDAEDFDRINDVAAAASFIPHKEKQAAWPRPIDRSLAPLSQ